MSSADDYPAFEPQVRRPLRIRVLQAVSVFLAVAGLIFLYIYSINRELPQVKVANITPGMNFAAVRIAGEVTRNAHLFDSGGVVFNLHDGTGEIAVYGARAPADALHAAGRLPRRGDHAEICGTLGIGADRDAKLRMQSADKLKLIRKSAPRSAFRRVRLADVTASRDGELVAVTGVLKEISLPRPGSRAPYIFILEDGGAMLDVVFWDEVFHGLDGTFPIPGKRLRVRGRVSLYHGTVQLKLAAAEDIREEDAL